MCYTAHTAGSFKKLSDSNTLIQYVSNTEQCNWMLLKQQQGDVSLSCHDCLDYRRSEAKCSCFYSAPRTKSGEQSVMQETHHQGACMWREVWCQCCKLFAQANMLDVHRWCQDRDQRSPLYVAHLWWHNTILWMSHILTCGLLTFDCR